MPAESINVAPSKLSFMAAVSGLVPAAAATDILTIAGLGGRIITINQIVVSGIATAAGNSLDIFIAWTEELL